MLELIIVSWTCFEHPRVHPQEDLYMLFYGIFVILKLLKLQYSLLFIQLMHN